MSWLLPDRRPRPEGDRFLALKTALFVIGAAVAVVGMALRRDWLITVALFPLAAGFALRFLARQRPPTK